jgi:hypothetical protein
MYPRGLRRPLVDQILCLETLGSRALSPRLHRVSLHLRSNIVQRYRHQRGSARPCVKRTHRAMFYTALELYDQSHLPRSQMPRTKSPSRRTIRPRSEVNEGSLFRAYLVSSQLLVVQACRNAPALGTLSNYLPPAAVRQKQEHFQLVHRRGFACSRPRSCASDFRTSNVTLIVHLRTCRMS